MLRKIDHPTKEHKNSNPKRNVATKTLVKLAIIVAVVLVQVGFQPIEGLARTTLVYSPIWFLNGDANFTMGQMRWSYDNSGPFSVKPIINVWNGKEDPLAARWTTFYNTHVGNNIWEATVIYTRYAVTPPGSASLGTSVRHEIEVTRLNLDGWIFVPVPGVTQPSQYAIVKLTLYDDNTYNDAHPDHSKLYSKTVLMQYSFKY